LAKVDPFAGSAVRFTVAPTGKDAVQVVAQLLIPEGELLTVPAPPPAFVTVREADPG
jgi:hypothetical protein